MNTRRSLILSSLLLNLFWFGRIFSTEKDLTTVFQRIFVQNAWGSTESVSGPGSTLAQTKEVRQWLPNIISELNITSILDAPCGDFNWMKSLDLTINYVGVDIVPKLIELNNALYKNERRNFFVGDITHDVLPNTDLILCRDTLVHLPYQAIKAALSNFKNSGAKYLVTTTFPDHKNTDINAGSWRPVNLQEKPFNLPQPISLLNEGCLVSGLTDKSLGLWQLDQVDIDEIGRSNFVIIIPSFNNARWYKRNLDSVCFQTYPHYKVLYIDDCSTDGTAEFVEKYIQDNCLEKKISLIRNEQKKLRHQNIYDAVWTCDPHDVIVLIDGDDWLYDNKVLEYLAAVYKNPDVWMTYGQFVYWPSNKPGFAHQLPKKVIDEKSYRSYQWRTTHLITFYADLFQRIKREDHLWEGAFFRVAGDHAMMFPMLEMAGDHSNFISKNLYVYNIETPFNNFKTNEAFAKRMGKFIREKPKYEGVSKLFTKR